MGKARTRGNVKKTGIGRVWRRLVRNRRGQCRIGIMPTGFITIKRRGKL